MKHLILCLTLFTSWNLLSQENRLNEYWFGGGIGIYNSGFTWSGECGIKERGVKLSLNYKYGKQLDIFDTARPDEYWNEFSFLMGTEKAIGGLNIYGNIGVALLSGQLQGDLLRRDTSFFVVEEYETVKLKGVGIPIEIGAELIIGSYIRMGVAGWCNLNSGASLFGVELSTRIGKFEKDES